MKEHKPIKSNFMSKDEIAMANLNAIQNTKTQAINTVLTLIKDSKRASENGMSVDDFLLEVNKIEKYLWAEPNRTKSKVIS